MCAETSTVLRAVAADFFFNCWYLEIPSDNHILILPRTSCSYFAFSSSGVFSRLLCLGPLLLNFFIYRL
jgi:hypothetical protein